MINTSFFKPYLFLGFAIAIFIIAKTANAQPLTGTRLDLDLIAGETLEDIRFSPNGQHIVYLTRSAQATTLRMYSVPSSGGTAVRLNTDNRGIKSIGPSRRFFVSPDSTRVLYLDNANSPTLNSVPISGGDVVQINANSLFSTSIAASFIRAIRFSPDGRKVLFEHTRRFQEYELFSNDIEGGSVANLNLPVVQLNSSSSSYQFSSNSTFIVYSPRTGFGNPRSIYRTFVDGSSQPLELTPSNQALDSFARFSLSPDDQRVVYFAENNNDGQFRLYSQSLSGANPTPLGNLIVTTITNATSANESAGNQIDFFSADSQQFFYTTQGGNLFSYSLQTNSTSRLTDKVNVLTVNETNDNRRLIFLAKSSPNSVTELYSSLKNGQSIRKLNNELDNTSRLLTYRTPNDRNLAAFQVFNSNTSEQDLFVVSPNQGDPIKVGEGLVTRFLIFNEQIFYLSDQRISGQPEWFRAELPDSLDESRDNDLCIPVKSRNSRIAVICL